MATLNKPAVVVAHPDTKEVITMFQGKDGNEYGRVRLDSSTITINNNMTVKSTRSVLITLTEEALEALEPLIKEGEPYPIEGKIQVIESLKPFYEGQEPKTKGAGGEVITHGGEYVYRTTVYNTDMECKDQLLLSDSALAQAVPTTPQQPENANNARE